MGDHFAAVTSKLSGTQSRLSQSLYTLKEFATHLLGLHAPPKEHITFLYLLAAPGVPKSSLIQILPRPNVA